MISEGNNMTNMITTESGLQYEVLVEGTGATPGPADTLSVSYTHLTLPTILLV